MEKKARGQGEAVNSGGTSPIPANIKCPCQRRTSVEPSERALHCLRPVKPKGHGGKRDFLSTGSALIVTGEASSHQQMKNASPCLLPQAVPSRRQTACACALNTTGDGHPHERCQASTHRQEGRSCAGIRTAVNDRLMRKCPTGGTQ